METCCHSNSSEKPSTNVGVKTRKGVNDNMCRERDETVNHIISECSKLTQKKYMSKHDWVGKGIH